MYPGEELYTMINESGMGRRYTWCSMQSEHNVYNIVPTQGYQIVTVFPQ